MGLFRKSDDLYGWFDDEQYKIAKHYRKPRKVQDHDIQVLEEMATLGLVRFGVIERERQRNGNGNHTSKALDEPIRSVEDAPLDDAACLTRTGEQLYREDRLMRNLLIGPSLQILSRLIY